LLGPALYYQFSYVADAATVGPDGEQRLLALFAQFRGWLNVAMLVMQIWLSGRLYRRLGLPLSLAFWPAAYLLGFVWLGLTPILAAAILGLGAARLTEDGIASAALRVIFNLFPDHLRSRAGSLLEGPINRLGGVIGNGLVMLALAFGAASWIGYGAAPIAVVWLAAALALRRAYPTLLLQASADRSLASAGAEKAQLLDPTTLRALAPHLAAGDPAECRAAIDLVTGAPPELAVGPLAEAVERAPEATRPILIDALHRLVEPLPPGTLRNPDAVEILGRLLLEGDLVPEQRADLLQVYARLTGGEDAPEDETAASGRVLQRTMGDRQAAVRLAAIAELVRRGRPPPGVPDLDTALGGALGGRGRDILIRRTARKELRAILLSSEPDRAWQERLALLASRLERRADRAETAEALIEVARRHGAAAAVCGEAVLAWVDDLDPRVRAAVLAFAGEAGLVDEAPRLARALGSRHPEEAAAAHEGLVALGAEAALKPVLEQGFGSVRQRDAAFAVLSELEVDGDVLRSVYRDQLQVGLEAVVLRGALDERPAAALVAKRLEERIAESLGSLLALMAVIRDEPRLAELAGRLRRAHDERRRDVLVEALEALLSQEDRRELASLLEGDSFAERAGQASEILSRRLPSAGEAWAELRRDRDGLTRGLAGAAERLEAERSIRDAPGVPDAMELAVRLQGVPAFDRLGTRELVRMAEALVEERREDGEEIYAEGDEGASLYFVLEGEVELSKGGTSLGRIGPERFFGEVSTLDGVPRALSARAAGAVALLRLDREDLIALMEDAPALGIGLSQHLALRVRELQERLQETR
ncbi:MAG: cyclic nucleotide-binding domain-containing protein, partial [Myxococcota bacterium]